MLNKFTRTILLLAFLLIIPSHAFAGLSENCANAVQCDPGQDYYGNGTTYLCQPHIETLANCGADKSFSCQNGCYPTPTGSSGPTQYCSLINQAFKTTSTSANMICGTVDDGDWKVSGNDMYSLPSGKVGIGATIPANKLDVEGSVAIGSAYSGTSVAPANGLIVEGKVGIGTQTPNSKLSVGGSGNSSYGIYSELAGGHGVHGYGHVGVYGEGTTTGVYGMGPTAIFGNGTDYGGYFLGKGYFSSNVGIGAAPSGNYRLEVKGGNWGLLVQNDNSIAGGMGISSWAGTFGVYGSTGGAAGYGGFFSGTTGVYGSGSTWGGYFSGRGYFSGNVGIGTEDTSGYKLRVEGAANVSSDLAIGGSSSIGGNLSVGNQMSSNTVVANTATINGVSLVNMPGGNGASPVFTVQAGSGNHKAAAFYGIIQGYSDFIVPNNQHGDCVDVGPFSEEQPWQFCPDGTYVAGMRCTGSNCDNITMRCCDL